MFQQQCLFRKKLNTLLYETYKALEQGGFEAQCDEKFEECELKLSTSSIDALEDVIAEQKQAQELIARTNPNAVVMFDALLTMGTFAVAKGYQWYRGENKAGVNNGEDRLLTAKKIALIKPTLIDDISKLANRYSNVLQSEGFDELEMEKQAEFHSESNASFKVLREQLEEFVTGTATVGDLLDIRYHIREINDYFVGVTDRLQHGQGAGLGLNQI